jgi:alkyl hydroperoxide reductase subunit D
MTAATATQDAAGVGGVEEIKRALPPYAKDLKLNLGSLVGNSLLSPSRLWGSVLAAAIASRGRRVLAVLGAQAHAYLSEREYDAASAAAAVMAMNTVYYRSLHLLNDAEYEALRAGLRMSVIGEQQGEARTDFELWSLAVAAINGCGRCLTSHERVLREADTPRETIQEVIKIASVVHAVAVTLEAEDVLSGVVAVPDAIEPG